jgi:hypothetical protein
MDVVVLYSSPTRGFDDINYDIDNPRGGFDVAMDDNTGN